jgi:hypothetical protein
LMEAIISSCRDAANREKDPEAHGKPLSPSTQRCYLRCSENTTQLKRSFLG